jgi:hypothetical protein
VTLALRPDERKAIGDYLRATADRLNLRDWAFEFKHEPAGENLAGTVEARFGQHSADIKLAHNFRDLDEVEQRETLIHELLHIHRESIRLYFNEVLPDLIGRPAFVAVTQAYRVFDEMATDAIANAIRDSFPPLELPAEPPAESGSI